MQKENVPLRNSSKIGGLQNGLNTGKTGKTRIELPRVIYHLWVHDKLPSLTFNKGNNEVIFLEKFNYFIKV